jgi:hypothetical protein
MLLEIRVLRGPKLLKTQRMLNRSAMIVERNVLLLTDARTSLAIYIYTCP